MSYIALGDAYGVTATIPAGNPKADAESWELYWRAGDDEQPAPPVGSSDGWQGPVDPDGDGDFSADWLDWTVAKTFYVRYKVAGLWTPFSEAYFVDF